MSLDTVKCLLGGKITLTSQTTAVASGHPGLTCALQGVRPCLSPGRLTKDGDWDTTWGGQQRGLAWTLGVQGRGIEPCLGQVSEGFLEEVPLPS